MLKFLPAFAILVASSAALAQSGSTQSPPAPNAGNNAPQPANSAPPGATNLNTGSTSNPNVSGPIGTTVITPSVAPAPVPAAPAGSQPMDATVPKPQ